MEGGRDMCEELEGNNKWYMTVPYDLAKSIIEDNIKNMSRSFIAIGFYLKYIRDNQMYQQDGYADIWEFAYQTYGIGKSAASRWMSMNDKYSKDGNSPVLQKVYQKFSKSQLQEMLYLEDEQLEDVKPEMTVKQIRQIKPVVKTVKESIAEPEISATQRGSFMKDLARKLIDKFYNWFAEDITARVTNVQVSEPLIVERLMQEPFAYLDILSSSEYLTYRYYFLTGEIIIRDLNDKHIAQIEYFYLAVQISSQWNKCVIKRLRESVTTQDSVATSQQENIIEIEEPVHFTVENASQCRQRPEYFCTLTESQKLAKGNGENCNVSCCWNCEKHGQCGYECNSSAHRPDASESAEVFELEPELVDQGIQDDNGIKLSEEDCVIKEYQTNLSHEEKRVLEDALVCSKESLEAMGEEWKEKQPGTYIKHKTLKAAYELMLMHGTPEKKYEPDLQPELQKFKNNEQRKEFIYDYKSWPVWFESKETGETHYRYNLQDGSSIVVRHYFQFLEWKNEDIENEEFFLLKDKKYFRDCSTNISTLIEHLKGIQKN